MTVLRLAASFGLFIYLQIHFVSARCKARFDYFKLSADFIIRFFGTFAQP